MTGLFAAFAVALYLCTPSSGAVADGPTEVGPHRMPYRMVPDGPTEVGPYSMYGSGPCSPGTTTCRARLQSGQSHSPSSAARDEALAKAQAALLAGNVAEAEKLADALARRQPKHAGARVLLARVYLERGDLDAAYTELRAALTISPRHVDALYYLGQVSARLSQQSIEGLAKEAPGSARVRQLQAEAFEAQENNAAAEAEYQAALEAQPDLVDALLGLARLKRIRLACEEAVALYRRAEAVRPTFDGAYGLASCHNVLQNDEEAVEHFRAATKRNPKSAAAWVGLGAALNKVGKPADAVAGLQRAIALEPDVGQAYYFLGMAYRALGDAARARAAFARAEALGGAMGGPR
jgi:tetratricopeptide (TPR) repeat protein